MRRILLCGAAVLFANSAWGQTADADLVSKLIARIDQLEKRVTELEGEKTARLQGAVPVPTAPVRVPETAPGMPGMPRMTRGGTQAESPPADSTYAATPTLHLAGFSDFNFVASGQKGAKSGFNEGQFILHVTSQLARKTSYFGELSVTARSDAGLGTPPVPGFNVEVERSIIRYEQNDFFKVSYGRYHTPINYWNTQFHHGSWLQTTAGRFVRHLPRSGEGIGYAP